MDRYFLITQDFPRELCSSEWQLKSGQVIKDVGTNMFVARSMIDVINKGHTAPFSQLNGFERGIMRLYISSSEFKFFEEIK